MTSIQKKTSVDRNFFVPIMLFILIWLPSVILIPYSRYNKIDVFIVNIVYVVFFLLTTVFVGLGFRKKRIVLYKRKLRHINEKIIKRIMLTCAFFSVIGLSLLIFDRVVIKGIDYAAGLRVARYQWLNSEVGSTWFGRIGNLLIPFSYVSLFFSYLNWSKFGKKISKWFALFAGVGVPLVHAMLNGGRSNLLIVLIFLVSISLIRLLQGMKPIPFMANKKIITAIIVIVIFSYVWSVFESSADMGGKSVKEYSARLIYALGGDVAIDESGSIEVMIIMLISYAFHGNWIMGQLMQQSSTGFYSLSFLGGLIDKLGLKEWKFNTTDWEGAFLNVPATFFHDFGWVGLIIAAIVAGGLFGYASAIIEHRKGLSIVELTFVIFIYGYVFLSPMVYAFGLTYFMFVLYAFIVVGVISRIRYGILDYGFEV